MPIYTYSKEEITNVVCDENTQAHVGEMEPVAQSNEKQRDNMVSHQLFEILSWLLHSQH